MPHQRPLGVHPSERPNWESMNEGQRRYAVEQYQLARLRRGLDIDHPNPITEPAPEPELPEGVADHVKLTSPAVSALNCNCIAELEKDHFVMKFCAVRL